MLRHMKLVWTRVSSSVSNSFHTPSVFYWIGYYLVTYLVTESTFVWNKLQNEYSCSLKASNISEQTASQTPRTKSDGWCSVKVIKKFKDVPFVNKQHLKQMLGWTYKWALFNPSIVYTHLSLQRRSGWGWWLVSTLHQSTTKRRAGNIHTDISLYNLERSITHTENNANYIYLLRFKYFVYWLWLRRQEGQGRIQTQYLLVAAFPTKPLCSQSLSNTKQKTSEYS